MLGSPAPQRSRPTRRPPSLRWYLALLLSLCLGLFLADGFVSLLDDSLIGFFGINVLSAARGIIFALATLMAILTYCLMGLTPMIPKRLFLPVTLFIPFAEVVVVPALIYFPTWLQEIVWVISFSQVIFGLCIVYWVQGGLRFRWPLVAENGLEGRRFSWLNLSGFLLANAFVLLPAVVVFLALCAHLAVSRFSDGFLALRPGGVTVQVRKYARNDGKTIQLVPMSHIGEPEFYRQLSHSFPTNSLILMEGVTDNRNLLTNKLTYKRVANSLGLAEQQKEFSQNRGEWVRADVDVEEFARTTIEFLNLVTLIHAKGVNAGTVLPLLQYSPPPHFQKRLFDDLLRKRNRRLLEEIQTRLASSENLIVPWGAAHMPEVAKEIQKAGFRLQETQEYTAIRFRSSGKK